MALTVLVADNDQTSLELITAVLTRDGFNVLATPDGADALSRFLEHQPSLVVCAESLPSLPAVQLCKQIKAQSESVRVVVLASGSDGASGLEEKLGCDAVLSRPFQYSSLKQALSGWGLVAGAVASPAAPEAPFSFSVPMPQVGVPDLDILAPAPLEGAAGASASAPAGIPLPIPVPDGLATPAPAVDSEPSPPPVAGSLFEAVLDVAALQVGEPAVETEQPALQEANLELSALEQAATEQAATEQAATEEPAAEQAAAEQAAPEQPAPVAELDLDAMTATAPAEAASPPATEPPELSLEGLELDAPTLAIEAPTIEAPLIDAPAIEAPPAAASDPVETTQEAPVLDLAEVVVKEPPSAWPESLELDMSDVAPRAAPAAPAPQASATAPDSALDLGALELEIPAAPTLELDVPADVAPAAPALELDVPPDAAPKLEQPEPQSAAAAGPEPELPPPEMPQPELMPDLGEAPAASEAAAGKAPREGGGGLPPSVPRYGDLGAVPLPRLVFELYCATFSGVLRLARHGMKRTIYFWGGLPVSVETDQVSEGLGRMLLEHGRITEAQYTAATQLAADKRWSEGEALVELGHIRRAELLDASRELTEQRLASSFAWRDGTYRVDLDQDFRDSLIMTEVHPLRAIFRGVREHYDLTSLLTYFANLRGKYAVASELFTVHFETLGAFLRDLDIATLLDGQTTFEDALRSDDRRAMEIAQALYVLLVTDMVRASQKPGAAAVLPKRRAPAPQASMLADYREMTRLCDEIAREYLRIKEGDVFEALRIDTETPPEEVAQAYKNIVRAFEAASLPPGLPEDSQRRAREICEILERARTVASDSMLKERYIAAQRAKFNADGASPPGAAATGAPRPAEPGAATLELDLSADTDREQWAVAERAFVEAQKLIKAQPALARQKLEAAVRLNPREPGYRAALAQVLLALAPRDAAVRRAAAEQLKHALEVDPSHIEANFEMGRLLANFGKPDQAKAHLSRVLQRAPEHREARAILQRLG